MKKNNRLNAFWGIIILFMMLAIPQIYAFGETVSIDERLKDNLTISNSAMEYPAISVKGFWDFMPLVEDIKADLVLTNHDSSCGESCISEFQIKTYSESALVEDIKFYRLDEGKTEERSIRSYQFQYYGNVKDYTTECSPAKLSQEELLNETTPYDVCVQIESGSHKDYINYNIGEILPAGTYDVKLLGQKAPYMSIDFVFKTQNKWLTDWATWGNISTGSQAEVRLNSPTNGAIQYFRNITTSAFANVTNGATLNNVSQWSNRSGTWALDNTTSAGFTESHGVALTSTSSATAWRGMNVTIGNTNIYITSIIKDSSSVTNGTAMVVTGTGTYVGSATFSGDVATFSTPLLLTAGSKYAFVVYSSGTVKYRAVTFPIVGTYLNWTKGIFNGLGSQNDELNEIVSVTTSTTTLTQTFTNNYTVGQSYKWNYKFCDSDGACGFATTNYTFSIDGTAPTIALNYPTSLINYGGVNTTLQLNLTVTEASLDDVWYNYNGTNITIAGAKTGVANLSNITLSTAKSIKIYANDTAGNLNTTTFTWDYKIFENSRTVNTTSYETAYETYSINVTANSSLTGVYLVYNGTNLEMTNLGSGIWSYARDLPTTVLGNNSIKFNFTYQNTFNSDTTYQNVLSILFTACNGTYTVPYLNLTYADESTLGALNASINLGTFDYYLGTGTVYKTLSYTNLTEYARQSFCVSPSTRNLTVDSYVQYTSTGYPQRIWNPVATSYSNATTVQTLYLLGTSNGIYVTFQIVNAANQQLSGVAVDAVRSISGTDVNVCTGVTGSDGTVTCWLNPDFSHTFTFVKTGFTTYTSTFIPTQTGYTVSLGGGSTTVNDYTSGMVREFYPAVSELVNNTAYTFAFNLSSSLWDVDSFGFSLVNQDGTVVGSDTSTTTGTAASIVYNTVNDTRLVMNYYWIVNSTYTNGSKSWVVYNTENSGWSIATFFVDLNLYMASGIFGLDDFGRYLITFLILFISVGVMSYKYGFNSPLAISFMTFLVVFFLEVVVNFIPEINGVDNLLTILTGIILAVMVFREVQT